MVCYLLEHSRVPKQIKNQTIKVSLKRVKLFQLRQKVQFTRDFHYGVRQVKHGDYMWPVTPIFVGYSFPVPCTCIYYQCVVVQVWEGGN